jgi:tRNA dimethylallyltransferase
MFIVGPTACGKSDLAVEIAEAVRAPIINCDSVQFFEGVDIGAAKPEPELLSRATHYLVGHVPLGVDYTAGDFRRDALAVMEREERERDGRRFLAVGGSGFYVQALEKGMYDVPHVSEGVREALEAELVTLGLASLYRELEKKDARAAAKINQNDKYRILRALEVLRSAPPGATLTSIREEFQKSLKPPPFRVSKIGVFRSRDILRRRVTERTRLMLKNGLIEEVESLRSKGLKDWAPLKSVGYKEVQEYLDGQIERGDLESRIVISTMQLAKRQMTWFKRDTEIKWFDSEQGLGQPLAYARDLFEP